MGEEKAGREPARVGAAGRRGGRRAPAGWRAKIRGRASQNGAGGSGGDPPGGGATAREGGPTRAEQKEEEVKRAGGGRGKRAPRGGHHQGGGGGKGGRARRGAPNRGTASGGGRGGGGSRGGGKGGGKKIREESTEAERSGGREGGGKRGLGRAGWAGMDRRGTLKGGWGGILKRPTRPTQQRKQSKPRTKRRRAAGAPAGSKKHEAQAARGTEAEGDPREAEPAVRRPLRGGKMDRRSSPRADPTASRHAPEPTGQLSFSVLLPGIPRPQDLSGNPVGIGIRDRLELLHASIEAIGQIQVPELIGRHSVRAPEASRLRARRAPAVEEVALLIELEDSGRRRVAHPDESLVVDEVVDHQRVLARRPVGRTQRPHVEELAVLVEHLHARVSTVDDEELAVGADRDAVDGVPLVGARVLRIGGRLSPVHDEFVVGAELRDARAAVAIADEVRPVGQPRNVGRPIERIRTAPSLSELAERVHQLPVVGEAVDHVQLVVDDPDVLLLVVGTDLDLVRAASAGQLAEQLVEVRPLVDEVAGR